MSETTRKLRAFTTYSVGACGVRDLAADVIEAVEAQVADAVARVAALEKKFVTTTDKIEPAPSAVPSPRGFREGDIVRIKRTANGHEGWHGQEGPLVRDGIGLRPKLRFKGIGEPLVVAFHPHDYDLVRAADAPEAPAEDAGLVERLARIIVDTPCAANHEGQCIPPGAPLDDCDRANARAVLSDLTAESRLCAPGEVARLKADRDDWKYAAEVQKKDTESWKARAETAEKALADANDRLTSQSRSIEEMHAEMVDLRDKLAAAEKALDVERRTMVMCPDGVTPTRRVVDSVEARERAVAEFAREDIDRKNELNALRADLAALKAKPRFRTRKVTKADVEEFIAHDGSFYESLRALGFRRRVDGDS